MNSPQKSTEFSAHLSWAAMRRYLQEALSPEESQRVERHLKHCPRCSAAIVEYIETEEPEHSKQYMKKLKGQLTSSQTVKKRFLSAFQIKALRTSTAVVALLIFSFFALKTVINKDTNHQLPSESLAVVKKTPKATTPPRKKKAKLSQPAAKTAIAKAAPKKKPTTQKTEVARKQPAKKAVVEQKTKKEPPKTRTSRPATQPATTNVAAKKAPEQSTVSKAPTVQKEEASPAITTESKNEAPAQKEETTKVAPLPTLEKLDTKKSEPAVTPLNSGQPAPIPVPGSKIGER